MKRLSLIATGLFACTAQAAEPNLLLGQRSITNGFGNVGLIQTPTARMAREGELSLYNMRSEPYRHMGLIIGVHPRLEAVVRYSDVNDVRYGVGENQGYKDKGLNGKLLLLREDKWLPAIAIGLNDVGGTNLFSSEYVVASKRFGRFDGSLGLGWGRLGARGQLSNPLKALGDSFATRGERSDLGGTLTGGNYFAGDRVGVFGGLSYQTRIRGLTLLAEYDGNDYSDEFSPTIRSTSPWNLGLSYHLRDGVEFKFASERGETVSMGIALKLNLTQPAIKQKTNPALSAINANANAENLVNQARRAGFAATSIAVDDDQVQMVGRFSQHRDPATALGRIGTALYPAIADKELSLITPTLGLDAQEWRVSGPAIANRIGGITDGDKIADQIIRQVPQRTAPITPWKFDFGIAPDLDQFLHTPESFVVYRVQIKATRRSLTASALV